MEYIFMEDVFHYIHGCGRCIPLAIFMDLVDVFMDLVNLSMSYMDVLSI